MIKKDAAKTVFDELSKVNMFQGKYDAKNGNEHFMYGICTVIEYIANMISEECHDEFETNFIQNMENSQNKCKDTDKTESTDNNAFQLIMTGKKFKHQCYEAYKLHWMIAHGRTLHDYLNALIEEDEEARASGNYPEGDTRDIFESLDASFEYETGFNGSIWACFDEFIENEFHDTEYMTMLTTMMNQNYLMYYQTHYQKFFEFDDTNIVSELDEVILNEEIEENQKIIKNVKDWYEKHYTINDYTDDFPHMVEFEKKFGSEKTAPAIIIKDITLLSTEETENIPENLKSIGIPWWLRSQGCGNCYVSIVGGDGHVYNYGSNVYYPGFGVRPALIFDSKSSDLQIGDKFDMAGHKWTVITNDKILCDDTIGQHAFRKNQEIKDANNYETSDIKIYLKNWAKEKGIL